MRRISIGLVLICSIFWLAGCSRGYATMVLNKQDSALTYDESRKGISKEDYDVIQKIAAQWDKK
ncbi:hypothetical protein [Falsibacillus albus]|uniref:Uncharacterized protein n=1 Tax=Falsibacillus albus TaxID=2478915 RepID=A0A3L7JNG7_9BACI|nr:hypothetical protein [Falsibacillus albus]RLQ92323.1 hypothetical protein D9X91_19825 [Falsibacillus albus]